MVPALVRQNPDGARYPARQQTANSRTDRGADGTDNDLVGR